LTKVRKGEYSRNAKANTAVGWAFQKGTCQRGEHCRLSHRNQQHYKVLGLQPGGSWQAVKDAYHQLCKQVSPTQDSWQTSRCAQRVDLFLRAYDALQRHAMKERLADQGSGGGAEAPGGWVRQLSGTLSKYDFVRKSDMHSQWEHPPEGEKWNTGCYHCGNKTT